MAWLAVGGHGYDPGMTDDALLAVRALLERERPRRDAALASGPPIAPDDPDVEALARDLASDATRESLAHDPYWPKWATPWWKLLLLRELGLLDRAPASAVDALGGAVAEKYLTSFPFTIDQVPPGADPHRDIVCHCALGGVSQVLRGAGRDPEQVVPWSRGWFLRYQLPDGGLNCDEEAYVRPTPRSSVVSTVPALEALLDKSARTPAEDAFLARGVGYLLARDLGTRSLSKGGPIDASWLDPVFPRFYLYDVLRGLTLVTRWALEAEAPLPAQALAGSLTALAQRADDRGALAPRRDDHAASRTLARVDGEWARKQPSSSFALLDRVRAPGAPSYTLTRAWYDALDALAALDAAGRLT